MVRKFISPVLNSYLKSQAQISNYQLFIRPLELHRFRNCKQNCKHNLSTSSSFCTILFLIYCTLPHWLSIYLKTTILYQTQGLSTVCSLCPRNSSLRFIHGQLLHLIQVSVLMSCLQWTLPWLNKLKQSPSPFFNIPLCFILFITLSLSEFLSYLFVIVCPSPLFTCSIRVGTLSVFFTMYLEATRNYCVVHSNCRVSILFSINYWMILFFNESNTTSALKL